MKKIITLLLSLALATMASDKPEFQAFAGNLLKFGSVKGGLQTFSLEAKGENWAFRADGQVVPPAGDQFVLQDGAMDGTVVAVVAYIPSLARGTDNKEYQVGMFDLKIYLEDELQDTRNVKFTLLAPANDEFAANMASEAVSTGAPSKGSLWSGANEVAITRTAAVPLDKNALKPKPKKVAKPAPAPTYEEAPPVQKKRVVKKRVEEDEEEPVVRKKVVKKKRVVEEDDEEEPVVRKKVVKKKRRVVEDDEEEPVVRKKVVKKKRQVVEEDEDEEEGLSIREKRRRAAAQKRKNAAQYGDYDD